MAWNIKIIMAYYLGNYTDRSSDRGNSGLADQLTGSINRNGKRGAAIKILYGEG